MFAHDSNQVISGGLASSLVVCLFEHGSLEAACAAEKNVPAFEQNIGNPIGHVLAEERQWKEARRMERSVVLCKEDGGEIWYVW